MDEEAPWRAMEADEPFLPFFWSAPGMEWCVAGEPKLALATPSVSGPWNARCEMICAKMELQVFLFFLCWRIV